MRALALLLAISLTSVAAADEHEHDHADDRFGEHVHDHVLEFGVAPALVYLATEQHFTFGLHVHAIAPIREGRWGLGLGFERLFDDHGHSTASAVVQLQLLGGWSALVALGATFEDGQARSPSPSVHLETTYEFEIGIFHIGPSTEVAIDLDDIHVSFALHLGVALG